MLLINNSLKNKNHYLFLSSKVKGIPERNGRLLFD